MSLSHVRPCWGSQVPDAPAKREPGHARGADNASGSHQSERLSGRVEIEPGRPAVGVGEARVAVHLDPSQQ